jgi:hypothetical protein
MAVFLDLSVCLTAALCPVSWFSSSPDPRSAYCGMRDYNQARNFRAVTRCFDLNTTCVTKINRCCCR